MALITKQGKPFFKHVDECVKITIPDDVVNWSIRTYEKDSEYRKIMTCVFKDKICSYYLLKTSEKYIGLSLNIHIMDTKGIIYATYIGNFRIELNPEGWYFSDIFLCIYENKIRIIQISKYINSPKIYDIYLRVSEMFTQPNTMAVTVDCSHIIISDSFTSIYITTKYGKPCVVDPDYSLDSNDLNWLKSTKFNITVDDNNYIRCGGVPFAYLTDDNFNINLTSLPHDVDIIKSVNQHTLLCNNGYYVRDLEKKILVKLEEDESPYGIC